MGKLCSKIVTQYVMLTFTCKIVPIFDAATAMLVQIAPNITPVGGNTITVRVKPPDISWVWPGDMGNISYSAYTVANSDFTFLL